MKRKLWNDIEEDLKDNLFNKEILNKFINKFYDTIIAGIDEDQHILFLFRIVLINDEVKTISKYLKLNKKNKEPLIIYGIPLI